MIYTNIDQVTILSVGFMLTFTAFNTCQSFAPKIMKDDGFGSLGFMGTATLYFCFAFASFFSTAIVAKVGKIKLTLMMGAFCYTFWIACFILPAFYQ